MASDRPLWRYELDERSFRVLWPSGSWEGAWKAFKHVRETDDLWLVRPTFGRRFVGLPKAAFSAADRVAVGEFLAGRRSSAVSA